MHLINKFHTKLITKLLPHIDRRLFKNVQSIRKERLYVESCQYGDRVNVGVYLRWYLMTYTGFIHTEGVRCKSGKELSIIAPSVTNITCFTLCTKQ